MMGFDTVGWVVAAVAILLTGISKSGLGSALGGLAVPVMALWISPREAVAVVLPILVAMDFVGIRAWRGRASWPDLKRLVPAALLGILAGTLAFGLLPDRVVTGAVGGIAVAFTVDRMLRLRARAPTRQPTPPGAGGWIWGAASGFTSTLSHAGGPPLLVYLLGRGLPRERFVATTVYYFAFINVAKIPFYIGLGLFTRETLLISAILLPLVPIGVWLGMRLVARIPERPFYFIATALLGLSGVKLLWDALA